MHVGLGIFKNCTEKCSGCKWAYQLEERIIGIEIIRNVESE